MQHPHSSTKEPLWRNGGLVVIRLLLLHVALARSVLTFIPKGLQTPLCLYLSGLRTGTEVSATSISLARGGGSHHALSRLLSGWWGTAQPFLGAPGRGGSWRGGEGGLIVDAVRIPQSYARLIAFCGGAFAQALRRNVCVGVWSLWSGATAG